MALREAHRCLGYKALGSVDTYKPKVGISLHGHPGTFLPYLPLVLVAS